MIDNNIKDIGMLIKQINSAIRTIDERLSKNDVIIGELSMKKTQDISSNTDSSISIISNENNDGGSKRSSMRCRYLVIGVTEGSKVPVSTLFVDINDEHLKYKKEDGSIIQLT